VGTEPVLAVPIELQPASNAQNNPRQMIFISEFLLTTKPI